MGKNSTVVAISFSPPEILEQAKRRARSLGFKNSFSAYVTKLVEEDIAIHDTTPPYKTNSATGLGVARAIVAGVGVVARGAAGATNSPAKPVRYRAARRSKKPPTA